MYKTLPSFFGKVFTSIAWNLEYEKPILFCFHPPLFAGALLAFFCLFPSSKTPCYLAFVIFQTAISPSTGILVTVALLYFILLFFFFVTKAKKAHRVL